MAESKDIEINQFPIVSSLSNKDYVVVSLDDGSQGRIKTSDLASVVAAAIPKGTFKIANCRIPSIQTEAIKVCSFVIKHGYYLSMIQINAAGFLGFSCTLVRFTNTDGNFNFSKSDLSISENYQPKIYILRNGSLFDVYVSGTYITTYNFGGITVIASDDIVSFANTGQIVSVDSIKNDATLLS